jgi:hypothetical protein
VKLDLFLIPREPGLQQGMANPYRIIFAHQQIDIDRVPLIAVQADCHAADDRMRNLRRRQDFMAPPSPTAIRFRAWRKFAERRA